MWWTVLAVGALALMVLSLPRLLLELTARRATAGDDEARRAAELLAKRWRERQRSLSADGVMRLPPPDDDLGP